MAILGFAGLAQNALPDLWDADTIAKVQLEGGRSLDEVLNEANAALAAVSAEFLSHPQYSGLFAVQDTPEVKYNSGTNVGVEEIVDYAIPNPNRGQTRGHMIPIRNWGKALGWTMLGLPERDPMDIENDIALAVGGARDSYQKRTLRRFFMMEGETVGSTSNASAPFADGGSVDADYIPPTSKAGNTFASSHDHFLRVAALNTTNVDAHILTLKEHGHEAPYNIIIPEADAGSWAALANWVPPSYEGIVYATDADRAANLSDVMTYQGIYKSPHGPAWVWQTPRLPTAYYGIYKAYGPGDPRNPLRMRIMKSYGYGFKIVPGVFVNRPNEYALYLAKYDVGVGQDRTNGVCVLVAGAGDYVTPTIS